MIIDVELWYWTPTGMRRSRSLDGPAHYVECREVERLLEEAHARGRREGIEACAIEDRR